MYWTYIGFDHNSSFKSSKQLTAGLCMEDCLAESQCQAFTFDLTLTSTMNCWLKSKIGQINMNAKGVLSGRRCSFKSDDDPPSSADGVYPQGTLLTLLSNSL